MLKPIIQTVQRVRVPIIHNTIYDKCMSIDTVWPLIPMSSVSETILYSSSLETCKFSRIYCYDLKVMFLYIDIE